jgi:hypothetical protein
VYVPGATAANATAADTAISNVTNAVMIPRRLIVPWSPHFPRVFCG